MVHYGRNVRYERTFMAFATEKSKAEAKSRKTDIAMGKLSLAIEESGWLSGQLIVAAGGQTQEPVAERMNF